MTLTKEQKHKLRISKKRKLKAMAEQDIIRKDQYHDNKRNS